MVQKDEKWTALVGFALKSRQAVHGFEAMRNQLMKNKVALVIVHDTLSANTLKKVQQLSIQNGVPLITITPGTDWNQLWGMETSKILGILKGSLGETLVREFNTGE